MVVLRNHLERRPDGVFAIPMHQRFDVMRMAGSETDDAGERRQSRHQRDGRLVKPPIGNANRVAWQPLSTFIREIV